MSKYTLIRCYWYWLLWTLYLVLLTAIADLVLVGIVGIYLYKLGSDRKVYVCILTDLSYNKTSYIDYYDTWINDFVMCELQTSDSS